MQADPASPAARSKPYLRHFAQALREAATTANGREILIATDGSATGPVKDCNDVDLKRAAWAATVQNLDDDDEADPQDATVAHAVTGADQTSMSQNWKRYAGR